MPSLSDVKINAGKYGGAIVLSNGGWADSASYHRIEPPRSRVSSKTYSPSRHTHLRLLISRSYLSAKDASSQQLAFINDAGRAVMKVDNSSVLKFPAKRNSIRIATKAKYTIGSLWVADMTHVPFGVSRFDYVLVVCLELLT